MRTLVLGIGNLLLGDEGVGVHAARALLDEFQHPDVTVLEVGTAILEALPILEKVQKVIVLDAVKGGEPPGTIYRMDLRECARSLVIASMHGFDFSRVLALGSMRNQPAVIVLGVEPAHIDWSLELSPSVAEALPALFQAVREEIGRETAPAAAN